MKKQNRFFSLLIFLIFTVLIKCIFQLLENNFILKDSVDNYENLIGEIVRIVGLIGLIILIYKRSKSNKLRY